VKAPRVSVVVAAVGAAVIGALLLLPRAVPVPPAGTATCGVPLAMLLGRSGAVTGGGGPIDDNGCRRDAADRLDLSLVIAGVSATFVAAAWARPRSRRVMFSTVAVTCAVAALVTGIVVWHDHAVDHRVRRGVLMFTGGCRNPSPFVVDGRLWVGGVAPEAWSEAGSVRGTFRQHSPGSATFTADTGGVLEMHGLPRGEFSDLGCAIQ
jgi:hypothetical protein